MRISKIALAKLLEIHPSSVTRYIARGMPVNDDGSLDRELSLMWISENINPAHRWSRAALRGQDIPVDVDKLLDEAEEEE